MDDRDREDDEGDGEGGVKEVQGESAQEHEQEGQVDQGTFWTGCLLIVNVNQRM